MTPLFLNGAFAGQRVTGQQRYASEVSAQLESRHAGVVLSPPESMRGAAAAHAWAHVALPVLSRQGALVSMTARSPVWARRHTLVVHDLFVLDHPEWYSASYVRTHAPVLSAQLRTASGLIAVSEPVAQVLRRRFPRKTVAVAPNAPSALFFQPSDTASPADVVRLTSRSGVEGFLFAVGSRDPRKNFDRLVSAYELLPTSVREAFPLVIAGGDSGVFASEGGRAAHGLNRIGYVSDEALAALYAAATAVAVPSLDEGFGLPVVEALAAGGRLAVSDIPTFRWVSGEDARYFRPDDVTDMARVLRDMLTNPPTRPSRQVADRFSWPATADVVAEFATAIE